MFSTVMRTWHFFVRLVIGALPFLLSTPVCVYKGRGRRAGESRAGVCQIPQERAMRERAMRERAMRERERCERARLAKSEASSPPTPEWRESSHAPMRTVGRRT